MGMGYGANFGIAIEMDEIAKVVPQELNDLLVILTESNSNIDKLAQSIQHNDELDVTNQEEIEQIFKTLVDTFKEKTNITLELNYHNADDKGDQYDEVKEAFFTLNYFDIYELTSQAKALKESSIDFGMKFWVSFG